MKMPGAFKIGRIFFSSTIVSYLDQENIELFVSGAVILTGSEFVGLIKIDDTTRRQFFRKKTSLCNDKLVNTVTNATKHVFFDFHICLYLLDHSAQSNVFLANSPVN